MSNQPGNYHHVRDHTELPPEPSTMVGLNIYNPADAEKYAQANPDAQVYYIEKTGITIRRTPCPVPGQES